MRAHRLIKAGPCNMPKINMLFPATCGTIRSITKSVHKTEHAGSGSKLMKKKPHGNSGRRNAAKPVQKQSLTIRLPPEIRGKAMAQPESASVYIERLIRADIRK